MNVMIINQCGQKEWHIKESLKECSKESVLQLTISKHKLGKNIDQSVPVLFDQMSINISTRGQKQIRSSTWLKILS